MYVIKWNSILDDNLCEISLPFFLFLESDGILNLSPNSVTLPANKNRTANLLCQSEPFVNRTTPPVLSWNSMEVEGLLNQSAPGMAYLQVTNVTASFRCSGSENTTNISIIGKIANSGNPRKTILMHMCKWLVHALT